MSYSDIAQLLGCVIVFITFFYTSLYDEYKPLVRLTDESRDSKDNKRKEILEFLLYKWVPFVIVPITLCDIVIAGAIFSHIDKLLSLLDIFTNLAYGICAVGVVVFALYTWFSFSCLCRLKCIRCKLA